MAILKFESREYVGNMTGRDIVELATKLGKMSAKGLGNTQEYAELNTTVKDSIIKYAVERAGLDTTVDRVDSAEDFTRTFNRVDAVRKVMFAVVREVVKAMNSKVEIQQILTFANIMSGADGDSANIRVKNNRLFKVERVGRSSNRSLPQFAFDDNQVIKAELLEASFAMDLYQMKALDYDFGEMLARLALSFRVQLQADICNEVFGGTTITNTPFVLSNGFTQEQYIAMAERLSAINGMDTKVYLTKVAAGRLSGIVNDKYLYGSVGDEMVKKGLIADIGGVPSQILNQAVDTSTNSYTFKVPNHKILLAPAGATIADVFMEGEYDILEDDGRGNAIRQRDYKLMTAWGVTSTASQNAFAVGIVGDALN